MLRDTAGFTLIEVLMVLLLVSILMAVAIPQFYNFGNDAKTAVTMNRLYSLKAALIGDARFTAAGQLSKIGYETNCIGLPGALSYLITQPTSGTCASAYNPFTKQGWRGPYVSATDSSWDLDGWGNVIEYFSATRTLTSCGPDGICGNSDDISITF